MRSFGLTRKSQKAHEIVCEEDKVPPTEYQKWRFNVSRSEVFPFFPPFYFFLRIFNFELCWDYQAHKNFGGR